MTDAVDFYPVPKDDWNEFKASALAQATDIGRFLMAIQSEANMARQELRAIGHTLIHAETKTMGVLQILVEGSSVELVIESASRLAHSLRQMEIEREAILERYQAMLSDAIETFGKNADVTALEASLAALSPIEGGAQDAG